jgi:hypothetical protein
LNHTIKFVNQEDKLDTNKTSILSTIRIGTKGTTTMLDKNISKFACFVYSSIAGKAANEAHKLGKI